MRRVLLFSVVALGAAGCSEMQNVGKTSCSDPDGLAVVTKLVMDDASKKLAQEKDGEGDRLFDSAAIRAQMARSQLAVTDIRTDKTDPNSTKVFCKGNLKVTLPAESLSEIDTALQSLDQGDLSALAGRSGMERSANVFTAEIEYALQPTDDRKSIYAEVPQDHASSEFLRWVAGSQLVASMRRATTAEKSIAAAIPEDTSTPADGDAAALVGESETVINPSFSCEAASTPIEKAICSDPGLADLDRSVAMMFEQAQRNYPDSDVRGLQVSWLQDVRNRCDSIQCLNDVYTDRRDYFASNFPAH